MATARKHPDFDLVVLAHMRLRRAISILAETCDPEISRRLKGFLNEEVKGSERKWYEFDPDVESVQEHRDNMLLLCPLLDGAERDVMCQLKKATWDGDLCSKVARGSLVHKGLAVRYNGWQIATQEGLAMLEVMGELKP